MVLRRREGITKNEDARRSGSSKEKEGVRMKLAPRRPRPGDPRRGLKKKVRGCESYYFQRRGGSFIKKGGATNTKRRRENLMAPRQLTSTALRLAGGGRKGISVADIVATGRERDAARRGGRARRRRRPSVSSLTLFSPRRRLGKYAVNSVAIRTGFDHHQTCFAF